ncbi:hypothetical protein O3P69_003830 [Scylla paramamosain]|uniref:Uncharacterized protein n=1 Tax=Scylla paramamosain TaxID=85552 RepID=A0AAW0UF19_SCYPA
MRSVPSFNNHEEKKCARLQTSLICKIVLSCAWCLCRGCNGNVFIIKFETLTQLVFSLVLGLKIIIQEKNCQTSVIMRKRSVLDFKHHLRRQICTFKILEPVGMVSVQRMQWQCVHH